MSCVAHGIDKHPSQLHCSLDFDRAIARTQTVVEQPQNLSIDVAEALVRPRPRVALKQQRIASSRRIVARTERLELLLERRVTQPLVGQVRIDEEDRANQSEGRLQSPPAKSKFLAVEPQCESRPQIRAKKLHLQNQSS